MRFGILFTLLCVLVLGYTTESSAQTTTASSTESGGLFETIIESVTGIKDTVAEETSSPSVLSLATEKRLTNLAANISNRLDGLNFRLRQIAGRIGQRIDKQAADGYNVDAARTSLDRAYKSLDSASSQLKNIDRDVYRAFRSQDPKSEWRKVRGTYISARDTIRTAHTELKTTVNLLKSAVPTAPIATSTATTTQ